MPKRLQGLKHDWGGGGEGSGGEGGGADGGKGGARGGAVGGDGGNFSEQQRLQSQWSTCSSEHVSRPKKSKQVLSIPHGLSMHAPLMGGGGGEAGTSQ